MKILLISPYIPYPPITGGKVRVLNFLSNLKGRHKIVLLCLLKSRSEQKDIPMVDKYVYRVEAVLRRKAWSFNNLTRALFSKYPFLTIVNNFSKATEESILKIIEEEEPDIVHLETFYMAQSLLAVKDKIKVPMLLSKVDVEAQVYFRNAHTTRNPLIKLLGLWDAHKMINYEVDVCRYFDYITCASDVDRKLLEKYFKKRGINKTLDLLPNGVDITHFKPGSKSDKFDDPTIIFVGNFRYFANTDAAFFFVKNCWDKIRNEVPNARLLIVGPRLTEGIQRFLSDDVARLAGNGVEFTNYVAEDEKLEYLKKAWVSIAPIRIGSGTKLKILEAMSAGLPVVTTSVGIEGIDAKNGKDVLVSDDMDEFARNVVSLLKDEQLRGAIGSAGRAIVVKKCDWKVITNKLNSIYQLLKDGQDKA